MKHKPFSIKLIALAYLLAPFGNILQIAYLNHWPFRGPDAVYYHLNTYEWCVLGAFPVVAIGIWKVSRWGYVFFMSFAAFLICQNTYAFFASHEAYSPYVATLFQLVTFGGVGFFVQKHIVAPYFNPKIRWWETSPRYKVDLETIVRKDQSVMKAHCLDISEGGCFVEIKKELGLADLVWLNISYKEWHFTAQGRVVWVSKRKTQGYGLMFTSLERIEKKKLGWILKDLKSGVKKSIGQTGEKDDSIMTA